MKQYYEFITPMGTMRGFFHKPDVSMFPVCLVFHGFTGQKTGTKFSYVQLARMLEKQNIGTIRLDFLGTGESDLEFKDMTFDDELTCARLLLEEVLKMSSTKEVYVLGHSMGGVIASELAKAYPNQIKKMCLWSPAFNLPNALHYLVGKMLPNEKGIYDHNGFEISQKFVDTLLHKDFYKDLNIFQNELLVIHGENDETVPYEISNRYLVAFHNRLTFIPIPEGTHNFDNIEDIKKVLISSIQFLCDSY